MAITDILKGHEVTTSKGPSGSEQTVSGITSGTCTINKNITPEYAAGSDVVYSLKNGNVLVTGSFSRFFNDAQMIGEALGVSATFNFVGINKGGSSHTVFDATDTWTNINVAPGSFPGTEIESTDYDMIEADDAVDYDLTASDAGDRAALRIKFDSIGTKANIDFLRLEIVGYGTGPTNGFKVYVWDGIDDSAWDLIATSTASAAQGSVVVYLPSPSDYIDASNDVFFMIVSSADATGTPNVLHLDFVELEVRDATEKSSLKAFNLIFEGNDGSGTVGVTLVDCKINDWNFSFANDGASVIETINVTAKSLTSLDT